MAAAAWRPEDRLWCGSVANGRTIRCFAATAPSDADAEKAARDMKEAVMAMKEQEKEAAKDQSPALAAKESNVGEGKKKDVDLAFVDRSRIWMKNSLKHFVDELKRYWAGTKLLVYEVKICLGLLRKVTKGKALSRRERRQLMRTSTDLLRLIPFAFFLVVPFMELLLPVALKMFPGMLPSTFDDSVKKEATRKHQLKAKIEVAKFLQQAVSERSKAFMAKHSDLESEFSEFMERVSQGQPLDNHNILKFSRLFEDEFTLDNLSREQLTAMCKYMGMSTFGTNGFLRYQLSNKVRQLKKDDRLIEAEGVDSLNMAELQAACSARGLKATSRSKAFLRDQLTEWLELSLTHNLPTSLLILANAFKITSTIAPKDALREALYHLPSKLVDEIRVKVAEVGLENGALKLEVLRKEAELIKEEELEDEQTRKEVERQQLLDWIQSKTDIAQSSVTFSSAQLKAITGAVAKLAADTSLEDETKQLGNLKRLLDLRRSEFREKADEIAEEIIEAQIEENDMEIAREKAALELRMASNLPEGERQEMLKQVAVEIMEEKLEDARELKQLTKRLTNEKKFISKLDDKMESLIKELEAEAADVASSVDTVLNLIDSDHDGVVTTEELQRAAEMMNKTLPTELVKHVVARLDKDQDGKILLEDLKQYAKEEQRALEEAEEAKEEEAKEEEAKAEEAKAANAAAPNRKDPPATHAS